MIAICSGMARSGSTWSFNVMKILLQGAGLKVLSGFVGEHNVVDEYIKENASNEHALLLKSHHPGPGTMALIQKGLAKSVRTYRDPRDCLASRIRFQKISFDEAMTQVLSERAIHEQLASSNTTLFIRYEDMMNDTKTYISRIAEYFGARLSQEHIDLIDKETNMESSKKKISDLQQQQDTPTSKDRQLDSSSLLQSNHIAGGIIGRWKSDFSERELALIQQKLEPWVLELGYPQS